MSQARIADPRIIRDFHLRMGRFIHACSAGLGGVPGDFARVLDWLQGQQLGHWKKQKQRREEAYTTARLAFLEAEADVRASRNGRGGGRQSSDDERRELNKAARLRDEAEAKYAAVQRWIQILEKDGALLVNQCRNHDLALQEKGAFALLTLDRLATQVEAYLDIKTGSTSPMVGWPGADGAVPEPSSPPATPSSAPPAEPG